jgi:hypothetical protein
MNEKRMDLPVEQNKSSRRHSFIADIAEPVKRRID